MSRASLPPMSSIGQKGPPQSFTAVFAQKQSDRRQQQLAKSGDISADTDTEALPVPKGGSGEKKSDGGGSLYGRVVAKIMSGLQSCYGTKISASAS